MSTKKKTKHINTGFKCENCDTDVPPIVGGGCRNHCPYCLVSKHVDNIPGDRDCQCQALMDPIDVQYTSNKGYVIIHKCRKCGAIKNNKAAMDSKDVNDSFDKIIEIIKNNSTK